MALLVQPREEAANGVVPRDRLNVVRDATHRPRAPPAELPRSLAVARSNNPDITQVFYLDRTALQQGLYASGRWQAGNLVNSGVSTTESNGPLAAVGWDDTALRTYNVVGDDLVKWASDPRKEDARWVRGAMPGSRYHL
jgi:hypothetical protein